MMGARLDGYEAKCPDCRKPSGRHLKDCPRAAGRLTRSGENNITTTVRGHAMNMDDTLLSKLVQSEHDALRDATGQGEGEVPAYSVPSYRPAAFTISGRVD